MKILSLTVENVYWLSQLISIVLLGGTVVCGGVALFTGKISNDRTQKELETERIKRLELEAKVAPRRLTGEQKNALSTSLKEVPSAVIIVSGFSDAEGSDFADDLDLALRNANWRTSRIRNRTDAVSVRYGVFVGPFDRTQPRDRTNVEAGKRLHDALISVGIENEETIFETREEATMSPLFKAGELYLVVAHKPPQ